MLCIGHRGAKGHAPENTIRSVKKAMEFGAPWVEIDVYHIDDHIIVIHDDTLERTTNGKGSLFDKSFSFLRGLDAGEGEKIPTLDEILDLTFEKTGLNIELKGPGTADPVIKLLQKRFTRSWGRENFLISSFDHKSLSYARAVDSEIPIGVLYEKVPENYLTLTEKLNAYSVNISGYFVTPDIVADAHNNGLNVFVYTVNNHEDIKQMKKMGVDGVFSDFPDRVIAVDESF